MDERLQEFLMDVNRQAAKRDKRKDRIIFVLSLVIVFLVVGIIVQSVCFWKYESQLETTETTETTTETKEIQLSTEGDSANAEYNDNNVQGDQYNDNVTHNEGTEGSAE